ncbi:MAG: hypothetical protein WCI59_20545 [Betaproteobacteria bacterium]|jgi:hypothetical protein
MNFKHIAIAATLAVSAFSSFAADIDLSAAAVIATPGTTAADFLAANALDGALAAGDTFTNNQAIIIQDDANTSALENIAYIDQVGTVGGLAAILQTANAGVANMAYILQSGTTNARAIITQR